MTETKRRSTEDLLGRARNRIDRIGIELEGGWTKIPEGAQWAHDGSVTIHEPEGLHTGEIPSPPLRPSEWASWVQAHYPSHCNASCGMHVHMSFRTNLRYQRLMRKDYMETLVGLLKKWADEKGLPVDHPLRQRLAGNNHYCARVWNPDIQARLSRKSPERYAVVNFCYSQHQTVEVRILPMFESKPAVYRTPTASELEAAGHSRRRLVSRAAPGSTLAIEAIQRVLDITNAFLLSDLERERTERVTLSADPGDFAAVLEQERISL